MTAEAERITGLDLDPAKSPELGKAICEAIGFGYDAGALAGIVSVAGNGERTSATNRPDSWSRRCTGTTAQSWSCHERRAGAR